MCNNEQQMFTFCQNCNKCHTCNEEMILVKELKEIGNKLLVIAKDCLLKTFHYH